MFMLVAIAVGRDTSGNLMRSEVSFPPFEKNAGPLFALKTAQTAQWIRQATLAPPRREKAEIGPYRQKKTLEASASRVVVEHGAKLSEMYNR